jgi:5-methylcytosine-specific restriction endonuclease McrA
MNCSWCEAEFCPTHPNQKLCSAECRLLSRRASKDRYKKSDKGMATEMRWRSSPTRADSERRHRSKTTAKHKAVIRSSRYLKTHSQAQEKKREADRLYWDTPRGRERRMLAGARYRHTDKAKIARKINKHLRRAGYSGRMDWGAWAQKVADLGNVCQLCGRVLREGEVTIDHIVPVSAGGKNNIDNLQPSCLSCNARKGAKVAVRA